MLNVIKQECQKKSASECGFACSYLQKENIWVVKKAHSISLSLVSELLKLLSLKILKYILFMF